MCMFFMLVAPLFLAGQSTKAKPNVYVKGICYEKRIYLRWVPVDEDSWKKGLSSGYKIEKAVTDNIEAALESPASLNYSLINASLLPYAKQDPAWKNLLKKYPETGIVYGALYPVTVKPSSPAGKKMGFGMVLKACDFNPELAKAHGLLLRDSILPASGLVVYRITLNAPASQPAYVFVNVDQPYQAPVPEIQGGLAGKKKITVTFNTLSSKGEYGGYFIERSTDSLQFVALHKTPYVRITAQNEKENKKDVYEDAIKTKGTYYYRIRGLTFFGFMGPPSSVIRVASKEYFQSNPFLDSCRSTDNTSARLHWKFEIPEDKAILKGFCIYRAAKDKGTYHQLTEQLLPAGTRVYTDLQPMNTSYYKVGAVSLDGDTVWSFTANVVLKDVTPPLVPAQFSGTIDSLGKVTLHWKRNTESDLKGYRLFRANALHEDFIEVNKDFITDTVFIDQLSLNALSSSIYYTLRAVDQVFNRSPETSPLRLRRPDRIPPVAASFAKAQRTDTSIALRWFNSTSTDVQEYRLLRSVKGEEIPVQLAIWKASDTVSHFVDIPPATTTETYYQYTIQVKDSSGNKSDGESPFVFFRSSFLPPVREVQQSVNRETRELTLSWKYDVDNVYEYVVYKNKQGEKPLLYKTLNAKETTLTDRNLYPGNTYEYRIKAIFRNGAESRMSQAIEIAY